ncbi:MAG TPA: phosphoribosylformylglycinamidine synthase subunit PurS [Tepidisphaeraceae bacterium]|jgi:phosphoribosylformylglycinamidine synthase
MIYRVDVRDSLPAHTGVSDPLGEAIRHQIAETGFEVGAIRTSRIFLIDADATADQMRQATEQLLSDPIVESAEVWDAAKSNQTGSCIEIHLKPGVMDPVAESTEMALRDLGTAVRQVRTGRAYLFEQKLDRSDLKKIAERVLANGVIESVHFQPFMPRQFEAGKPYQLKLQHVELTKLSDEQLQKLSRDGHLFLSLDEMHAIQNYFQQEQREPTDVELETIAQTWSEHCVHKTLKSAVDLEMRDGNGKVLERRHYDNLIRDTIFASTQQLMEKKPGFCLSVFKDNAGIISFDQTHAVCFKVETHNHPSAIEPYGGSATGIGGVIRDILGTGLSAKPIANTDVFCVAPAKPQADSMPKGVLPPKRVLQQIVAGVRDYGNRMGIPTVNGAVYFDENYLANPLVFCGCVGLIPRDKIEKRTHPGDAIVVMGGRTGRDGIHGATFSSAELTDTHADEFSHAVQIGNAITEKKMADVILQARDQNLFHAVTDCGAGGLSSAIGEMGEETGAQVHLDRVPLKYAGLRYDEIWISEAQERMVLAVPQENIEQLLQLAKDENVEATVIGTFGTENAELVLHYGEKIVGRLSMNFLHHGLPKATRKAVVIQNNNEVTTIPSPCTQGEGRGGGSSLAALPPGPVVSLSNGPLPLSSSSAFSVQRSAFNSDPLPTPPPEYKGREIEGWAVSTHLLRALAHPNIASKHWIIRQYDHEVQGGSVIKPLIGPLQIGPSDAAVIRPKLSSQSGIAIACGLTPHISDPYAMAIAAIDEAIRNVVAVGADFDKIAILDNFCWPSVDDEITMGTLVRACEACRDAALAFGIPFISGKDSLHNQFTDKETGKVIRIPNTLLISAMGIVPDVARCVTMDFKQSGAPIYLVSANDPADLKSLASTHRSMAKLIAAGRCATAHDVSDGGWLVTAAEMCIASGLGVSVEAEHIARDDPFAERPGRYIIELSTAAVELGAKIEQAFSPFATAKHLGFVQHRPSLLIMNNKKIVEDMPVSELTTAWRGTLDW